MLGISNSLILTVNEIQSLKKKVNENVSRDLKFNRECLTLMRKLDTGQYGSVYVAAADGILDPGTITEVVIKTFQGTFFQVFIYLFVFNAQSFFI